MRIAIIGVGVMGSAITARLLRTGAAVWVYDAAPGKCQSLASLGAQAAGSARQATLPVASLITDLHRMLVAGGLGEADSAAYIRLFDLASDRAR